MYGPSTSILHWYDKIYLVEIGWKIRIVNTTYLLTT